MWNPSLRKTLSHPAAVHRHVKPIKMENDRPATSFDVVASNACFIAVGNSAQSAAGGKKPELNPTKSLRYSKGLNKLVNQSAQSEPTTATHQAPKRTSFLESFIKKTKRNTATAKPAPPPVPSVTSKDSTPSPSNETKLIKPELVTPPSAMAEDSSVGRLTAGLPIVSLHTIASSTTPLLSSQSLDQSVSPFKKKQLLEIEKLEKSRRWSESASTTVNKISSKLKSTVIVDESGKRVHHSTNTSGSSGSSFTEKEDCIEE